MARGYSYVQMLMVISLLAILAAASSPYYFSWQQRQQVRSTSSMLLADLRLTQSRSMQREQNTTWSILVEDSAKQYHVMSGANAYQTITYPDSIVVSASPTDEVEFAGLTGAVAVASTITITSSNLSGASDTITINAAGVME